MKVGDYVRTKKGIAKYLGLGRDILKHETSKDTYEHYYSQHLFDNYIFNVGHDYGDSLTYDEFNNIDKLGKVKESIIDLIELGDVLVVKDFVYEACMIFTDIYVIQNEQHLINIKSDLEKNKNKKLYSIVTKEQFESMEYKVKYENQ